MTRAEGTGIFTRGCVCGAAAARGRAAGATAARCDVLVVDDDRRVVSSLLRALRGRGLRAEGATLLEEARAKVDEAVGAGRGVPAVRPPRLTGRRREKACSQAAIICSNLGILN